MTDHAAAGPAAGPAPARGVCASRFAAELGRLRRRQGLSLRALAGIVPYSSATLHKVEAGLRWPSRDLAERCDAALGGGGVLTRLWPWVEAEQRASDGRRRQLRPAARVAGAADRSGGLVGVDRSAMSRAAGAVTRLAVLLADDCLAKHPQEALGELTGIYHDLVAVLFADH